MSYYGPKRDEAYWAELRTKANANMQRVQRGEHVAAVSRRDEDRERERRLRESAKARKIALGSVLVERYDPALREFNRLMRRKSLTQQELGEAEHWQSEMDTIADHYDLVDRTARECDSARRAYKAQRRGEKVHLPPK